MNFRQIEILLEQYFIGETSLEDEKTLREFFKGEDIPPHLASLKSQFEFFSNEKENDFLDKSFDDKILSLIDEEKGKSVKNTRKQYLYVISGIAASILIIVSIFTKFDKMTNKFEDTFDNPEMAYEETKKALYFVSEKLNLGLDPVKNVKKFGESIEPLKKMKTINSGRKEISNLAKIEEVRKRIIKN